MDIRTKKRIERVLKGEGNTLNIMGFLDLLILTMIFISLSVSTLVPYQYMPAFLQLACVLMWFEMLSMWMKNKRREVPAMAR